MFNVSFYFNADLPIIPEVDLAFAISANAARSEANFQKMKDVIGEVVDAYGKERIHYSLIIFGSSPSVKITFNDEFASDELLKTFIGSMPIASGSALDTTLQKAKETFERYARPGVRRVLVVITDKKSDSAEGELREKASLLEMAKVKVIPVGLGEEVDDTELEIITTRSKYVIKRPSNATSKELARDIMAEVLEGNIRILVSLFIGFTLVRLCQHNPCLLPLKLINNSSRENKENHYRDRGLDM